MLVFLTMVFLNMVSVLVGELIKGWLEAFPDRGCFLYNDGGHGGGW